MQGNDSIALTKPHSAVRWTVRHNTANGRPAPCPTNMQTWRHGSAMRRLARDRVLLQLAIDKWQGESGRSLNEISQIPAFSID